MVRRHIIHEMVHEAWNSGSVDALFGTHDRIVCPWPRLPAMKGGPKFPNADYLLKSPPALVAVDPRELWSTQPWILRQHVDYYTSGIWERTGETSADMHIDANRFPIVVKDHKDRPTILTGHHRAAAALIDGRLLRVRWVANSVASRRTVLPLLDVVHRGGTPTHNSPIEAAYEIFSGGSVIVPDRRTLVETMRLLGLTDSAIRDRFRVAMLSFNGWDTDPPTCPRPATRPATRPPTRSIAGDVADDVANEVSAYAPRVS
jgi:hypothetical protein